MCYLAVDSLLQLSGRHHDLCSKIDQLGACIIFSQSSYFISCQSENLGPIRESSLGCILGVVLFVKKLHFVSRNWRKEN